MLDAVVDNPERLVAANDLLDLLLQTGTVVGGVGGAVGGAVYGLFHAVKFLRGNKPEKVEDRGDGFTAITVNHTTIIVDKRTVSLLKDIRTREALETFGDKSLGIAGVESLRIGETDATEPLILTPSDRVSFHVPPPGEDDTRVETVEREVLLKIVTSHFRDGYKWRFTDGGEKPFTADIADVAFLNSVLEGKLPLSANDTLRCRIQEEQRLSTSGLTKEIKVLEVVEHIPGPRQLKLI